MDIAPIKYPVHQAVTVDLRDKASIDVRSTRSKAPCMPSSLPPASQTGPT